MKRVNVMNAIAFVMFGSHVIILVAAWFVSDYLGGALTAASIALWVRWANA